MRYEYYCEGCGHKYEMDTSVDERDYPVGTVCPVCKDGYIMRSVGNAGFVLKGNCWAKDGYSSTLGDAEKFERS